MRKSVLAKILRMRTVDYCQEVPLSQPKSMWTIFLRQRLQAKACILLLVYFYAMVLVALQITTCVMFEVLITVCEA